MWELLGALFLGSIASGFVPFINAELLVMGAATAVAPGAVPAVVIVCTVGQMIAKTTLFLLAGRLPSKLPERARKRMEKASAAVASRHGTLGGLIFASAALGFPPFYGVSLAVGSLRMRMSTFLVGGLLGRAVRFGVIAWASARWGDRALEYLGIFGH